MYIYTIDEQAKDALINNGCTLMFETTDIQKKSLWCLKMASQFSFDINNSLYKGKCILSEAMRMDF